MIRSILGPSRIQRRPNPRSAMLSDGERDPIDADPTSVRARGIGGGASEEDGLRR